MSVGEDLYHPVSGKAALRGPIGGIAKRTFDLVVATIALLFLLPVMVVVGVCVWLTDRGPIVFAHERIGLGGRKFKCYKFRSMVADSASVLAHLLETDPEARAEWNATQKLRNDPRITTIGRFLRVTSLDELPQLWNVIRGDMSLIGPRPIVASEASHYAGDYPHYIAARPGISGLWQVSGRSDTSYPTRVKLDVAYVSSWSLALDITIIMKTVVVVLTRRGSV